MLHGIVSDIDMKSKTVTVDVTTSGCIGIRTFSFRDIDKRSFKTGDKVNFFIDSETCNGIGSDRIRDLWRVK